MFEFALLVALIWTPVQPEKFAAGQVRSTNSLNQIVVGKPGSPAAEGVRTTVTHHTIVFIDGKPARSGDIWKLYDAKVWYSKDDRAVLVLVESREIPKIDTTPPALKLPSTNGPKELGPGKPPGKPLGN